MSACPACQSRELSLVYSGSIRVGKWGNFSPDEHKVMSCADCLVWFLASGFESIENYQSGQYHAAYRRSPVYDAFLPQAVVDTFQGKSIVDVGAADGAFLSHVAQKATRLLAIEPSQSHRERLAERYEVYSYSEEVPAESLGWEIACSFNVVEHVERPIEFLQSVRNLLAPKGRAYIVTPNREDVIGTLVQPEFSKYFFRSAHRYYYSAPSLKLAMTRAGFGSVEVKNIHKYDFPNLLYWLTHRRPAMGASFGSDLNDLFPEYNSRLEARGGASHLIAIATFE
jgi:SAM-dependent methyltransferase